MDDGGSSYRGPARLLHWLVALLVFATIPAGFVMAGNDVSRSLQDILYVFHKNTGVLILLLVVCRLAYRFARPAPPLPASMPAWQAATARATHAALYTLLVVMALSGYVYVKAGGYPIEVLDALGIPPFVPRSDALSGKAQSLHIAARTVLIALIAIHVAAALHHGVVRRDGVLWRMRPW